MLLGLPVVPKPDDFAVSHDLTHARHDPAHCSAPGLFRSLKRGDRKRLKLDVVYQYNSGERIEFKGPEPLGADDLRVLQGLIAMGGPRGDVLGPEPKTEEGRQLRLFLEPRWGAVQDNALVVKSSFRALAKTVGYELDSGGVMDTIKRSIERLWAVSIIVEQQGRRMGFRLLSAYASENENRARGLHVALNPRITRAILGGRTQHIRIELDEVRQIEGDVACIVHQRLCAWINPGKSRRVTVDTLAGYAWPEPGEGSCTRMRHKRVREALDELRAVRWVVHEYARGKFEIARPVEGRNPLRSSANSATAQADVNLWPAPR